VDMRINTVVASPY